MRKFDSFPVFGNTFADHAGFGDKDSRRHLVKVKPYGMYILQLRP